MRLASKNHIAQRDGVTLRSYFSQFIRIPCSVSILLGVIIVAIVGGITEGGGFGVFIVSVGAPIFVIVVCALLAQTKTMTFIDNELIFKAGSKYYSIYANELQGYCFKQVKLASQTNDRFNKSARNFSYGKVMLYIDGKQYFVKCGSLYEAEACLKAFIDGEYLRAHTYEYYERSLITQENKRFAFRMKYLCIGSFVIGAITELLNINGSNMPHTILEIISSLAVSAFVAPYIISLIQSIKAPNPPSLDGHIYFRSYGSVNSVCKEKLEEKLNRSSTQDSNRNDADDDDGFYE